LDRAWVAAAEFTTTTGEGVTTIDGIGLGRAAEAAFCNADTAPDGLIVLTAVASGLGKGGRPPNIRAAAVDSDERDGDRSDAPGGEMGGTPGK